MRAVWVAALLLLLSETAAARIGETPRVCEQRYGRPVRVSDTGSLVTYRIRRLSVVAHFAGGLADMLSFRKLPAAGGPATHVPAKAFTDAEIQELVETSASGGVWILVSATVEATTWRVEDGSLHARWDRRSDSLTVYTQGFADHAGLDPP
jgi:hypothetical protein